jgi:hypothetical protein
MIDNRDFEQIINLLEKIPTLRSWEGRQAWLTTVSELPPPPQRSQHNHRNDLRFIVRHYEDMCLVDNRNVLVILLKALRPDVKSLDLRKDLRNLILTLEQVEEEIDPSGRDYADVDAPVTYDEVIIGYDEKVTTDFLINGLSVAKAVARLQVSGIDGSKGWGTGWLIAPGLLITNHHVIANGGTPTPQQLAWQAAHTEAWFGYDAGSYTPYACEELLHANSELDYALLRVLPFSSDGEEVSLENWGSISLVRDELKIPKGARLNIIQHPGGRPKEFALRSNYFMGTAGQNGRFHYLSDTERGSSGSPVLNDHFFAVGLHRGWNKYSNYYTGQPIRFNNLGVHYQPPKSGSDEIVAYLNEGVLIHDILADLPPTLRDEIAVAQGWES